VEKSKLHWGKCRLSPNLPDSWVPKNDSAISNIFIPFVSLDSILFENTQLINSFKYYISGLSNSRHVNRIRSAYWFRAGRECILPYPKICVNAFLLLKKGGGRILWRHFKKSVNFGKYYYKIFHLNSVLTLWVQFLFIILVLHRWDRCRADICIRLLENIYRTGPNIRRPSIFPMRKKKVAFDKTEYVI
jgi:hypothetical protein